MIPDGHENRLAALPLPWRALLTCVLIFLAAGYFAALLNVYAQSELADGQPGLTSSDLIFKYHGAEVEVQAGRAAPSRMLEMIGTSMRQYFTRDEHYNVLHDWLAAGALEKDFTGDGELTPEVVIVGDCLRCHAADSGEPVGARSPFGPDIFTARYDEVAKFTLAADPGTKSVWRAPRDWRGLALSTHAHMLSVPLFASLLAGMFLLAGWPRSGAWRTVLACAPLVFFLVDVAFWWLARLPGAGRFFAFGVGGTGALFGAAYGLQWVVVALSLWHRPRRPCPAT